MATYRATAWFQLNGLGWSESYHRDAGGETDLAVLADFDRIGGGGGLWTKRAAALGKQATLVAQETSFDNVTGDSVLNYIPISGNAAFNAEDATTALLIRCGNTTNTKRKNIFFRGIADDIVIEGGQIGRGPKGLPAFEGALTDFLSWLIQNNYGWLGIDTSNPQEVDSVVEQVDTHRQTITLKAGPIPAGDMFNLVRAVGKNMGVGKRSQLDGPNVYIRTSNTVMITKKPTAVFPYPGDGGFMVFKTYVLIPIKNTRVQKVVERKVGKPSHLPRGRALARPRG